MAKLGTVTSVINGKKYCRPCETWKSTDEFYKNGHNVGGAPRYSYRCKSCESEKYGGKFTRRNVYRHDRYRGRKQDVLDYLGTSGCKCGEARLPALQFHHNGDKLEDLARLIGHMTNKEWKSGEWKFEADKCVVMCANCHLSLHSGIYHKTEEEKASTIW
jgi:hypothetical protein